MCLPWGPVRPSAVQTTGPVHDPTPHSPDGGRTRTDLREITEASPSRPGSPWVVCESAGSRGPGGGSGWGLLYLPRSLRVGVEPLVLRRVDTQPAPRRPVHAVLALLGDVEHLVPRTHPVSDDQEVGPSGGSRVVRQIEEDVGRTPFPTRRTHRRGREQGPPGGPRLPRQSGPRPQSGTCRPTAG